VVDRPDSIEVGISKGNGSSISSFFSVSGVGNPEALLDDKTTISSSISLSTVSVPSSFALSMTISLLLFRAGDTQSFGRAVFIVSTLRLLSFSEIGDCDTGFFAANSWCKVDAFDWSGDWIDELMAGARVESGLGCVCSA
jgi:hypothetical protein